MSQHKHNDGQNRESDHDCPIVDLITENYERLVAEEIEEDPEDDQDGQDQERGWVIEQAYEEDEEESDGVICSEVDEIRFDSRDRVQESVRESHGIVIEHRSPWAARSETGFYTVFGP